MSGTGVADDVPFSQAGVSTGSSPASMQVRMAKPRACGSASSPLAHLRHRPMSDERVLAPGTLI